MAQHKEIGTVENHREREKGVIVYPVYSRRSGGLSVGVNLYPDKKQCNFNCPYCEVFPFTTGLKFSLEQMEEELREVLATALKKGTEIKDICFSGNGEPTLSPSLPTALARAAQMRDELVPKARLIVITNGTGFLSYNTFAFLEEAARGPLGLHLWVKIDAILPFWYAKINSSPLDRNIILEKINIFAQRAPFSVQTMHCAVDDQAPPAEELRAWEETISALAVLAKNAGDAGMASGALHRPSIRSIQIYGKVRPSPGDPKTVPLPPESLEARAQSLRRALEKALPDTEGGVQPPVEVFL